ncbi:MAG: HupE/UreJ family protein [Gemmobacter sp.]
MRLALAATLALVPAAALAHPGHGEGDAFLSGVLHPLLGPDHLLAMVAVGLWAALAGRRAVWAYPAAFVAAMLAGGLIGAGAGAIAAVEPAILASVIALGAATALALRLPLGVAVAALAVFGLAHGHAHGVEGPGGAAYAAGFVLATAALHAGGLALGLALARLRGLLLARAAGVAVMTGGLAIALAPGAEAHGPGGAMQDHGAIWGNRPVAEWVMLGTHVHGGFGSLIALGIRIGQDAAERLDAQPRQLTVSYRSHPDAPCPCVIDGLQVATRASLGTRTLTLSDEPPPADVFGIATIRNTATGAALEYTIPMAAWPALRAANQGDVAARWSAVMDAPEATLFTRAEPAS